MVGENVKDLFFICRRTFLLSFRTFLDKPSDAAMQLKIVDSLFTKQETWLPSLPYAEESLI